MYGNEKRVLLSLTYAASEVFNQPQISLVTSQRVLLEIRNDLIYTLSNTHLWNPDFPVSKD